MADKSINQLPVSSGLTDDGLLVVYQNSETKSITGSLIKQFAQQGIEAAMAEAKASGEFDGKDGEDGEDAVSPTIAVSDITGGHRLTVTDKDGTKTVDVMDGTDGEDGYTPQKGKDYTDGQDGVSPTITTEPIAGGHRMTITDVNGTQTIDLMDGVDGEGAGDMLARVYDPQGKAQDVFKYVDDAVGNIPTPDVSGQINTHNADESAHADIRTKLTDAHNVAYNSYSLASEAKTAANNAVKYGDPIMSANAKGGKQLFISSIDNALHAADKRWFVTVTTHAKVVDGVTYPHTKDGGGIADDDYWVDSPVVETLDGSNLFASDYESGCSCPSGHYMKVHIQFNNFDGWKPSTGGAWYAWTGYPYGDYYLSFYGNEIVAEKSEVRIYNLFASQTVGWKLHTFSPVDGIASPYTNCIQKARADGNFLRSCVEFILYAKDNASCTVTNIDWKVDRHSTARDSAMVTKYGEQKMYYPFKWGNQTENNVEIYPDGTVKAKWFTGAVNPTNLSVPVPIEKGGTGAASAADARTALGVPSTTEMNTAIANAIGTALEASY